MLFNPKSIMVAAAFLGSKVKDGMVDIQYLEEWTEQMKAAMSQAEIIALEVALLAGTHFDLLCFHPYKAIVALMEDLHTHLKTPAGQQLLLYPLGGNGNSSQDHLVSADLKPMYDGA